MSVGAARVYDDRVIVAADSIILTGNNFQEKREGVKLWESPLELIIATAGSVQEGSIMRMFSQNHRPESATEQGMLNFLSEFASWQNDKTSKWGVNNSYIFAYQGKVFEAHGLCIQEAPRYCAIGAGFSVALTALHLGFTPSEACETACELTPYCERPVHEIVMART